MNIQFQNMPKHVAVYARVSTDEQADRGTIEAQLDFARKYCDLHGITIVKIYKDDGITGTLPLQNRPMGAELLEDARRKLFSTVLVYKLDRLGRSTRVILNAVHDLEESDIKLKSMTEPFDTADSAGRFLLTILAGVADLERSNILERMWLGANRAASQGKWLGGIVPYGYVMTKDKFLKINDESLPNLDISEADIIRLIYKLCGEEGKTTYEIAEHLNALHVPTAYVAHGITGKRHKQVSGNWLPGRVRNMIVEPIYKGIHYYGRRASRKREIIERRFPAIISEELWDKAQKTLKTNQLDAFRNAKHFYLLRGLIRCKNCGFTYRGNPSGNGAQHKYSYYTCGGKSHRNELARQKCLGMAIRMEWIDDWIWGKCLDYINNPVLVRTAILTNQESPNQEMDAELALIQQQLEQEAVEKERLVRLYTTGIIEIDEISKQLETIKHNRVNLEKRKEELSQEKEEAFSAVESAEEILDLLRKKINSDELTPELKRNIIRVLVDRIEVFTSEDKKMEITAYFKFKESSSTNYEKVSVSRRTRCLPSSVHKSSDADCLRNSMHDCTCGWAGDPEHECDCTPNEIKRYTKKISGPLLDRIDIHIRVPRVEYKDLSAKTKAEPSSEIRKRVVAAREIQLQRFKRRHIFCNAQMNHALIQKFCPLTDTAQNMLEQVFKKMHMSARSYDRIIKVSRTIADLDKSDMITERHIGEAIQFRNDVGLDLN